MESKLLFDILVEGNPNSLGRALEVFNMVMTDVLSADEVYDLYQLEHRIVSMRVSNIIKRVWRLDMSKIIPLVDRFISDSKTLMNPTFRWTLAQMYREMYDALSKEQCDLLLNEIKRNLIISEDWITLTQSLETLLFAKEQCIEVGDLTPYIKNLVKDKRKSVKSKVLKVQEAFGLTNI